MPDGQSRIQRIVQAINILDDNPRIGRPAEKGRRELIIGKAPHGYVALYRYAPAIDVVYILAIRHQREAGYRLRE